MLRWCHRMTLPVLQVSNEEPRWGSPWQAKTEWSAVRARALMRVGRQTGGDEQVRVDSTVSDRSA